MPTATARLDAPTLAGISVELFHQGKRTISFLDLVSAYQREYDARFIERVVALLPDTVKELESREVFTALVNDYCLRYWKDTPITDVAEARRCNVFNSGGKPPVGIRLARPDDLVRPEVNGSQSHLALGSLRKAVEGTVQDVAIGITAPETQDRLLTRLRSDLPKIAETQAEPVQAPLTDDEE